MTHAAATHSGSALCRCVAILAALSLAPADAKAAQEAQVFPRVRTDSAIIGTAIAEGTDRSETFRRLVNEIGASDGLVYVEEGECGHSVNACLLMLVTIAGPSRVLHIRANPRKAPDCELVELIGHELRHAVEALREPRVQSSSQIYHFFSRIGPTGLGRFETAEAVNAGLDVAHEACRKRPPGTGNGRRTP
jgi:hypothetical protein